MSLTAPVSAARPDVTHRLLDAMALHRLDALVCLSPENVAYAAGFVVPSQPLMRWRHAALVLRADGAEAMVCVDMEESTVRANRPDLEVRAWPEFSGDAMATLADTLAGLGVERGRIGLELDYLPVADHARLAPRLPDAEIVAADRVLDRVRRVKTPAEIDLLAGLARAADGAIRASFDAVRAGDTEMDLAAALTRGVYDRGATAFKLMIVATGERSQLPNVGPTARALAPGDVCRVEIFAVDRGYQAGVCRTAVVGDPAPEPARVYAHLAACRTDVLAAIVPGATGAEVYRAFRRRFDELGLAPIDFVGHSIGVNLHEAPYLGPGVADELEPGVVLGVEPLAYRAGPGFGIQIKDMVAVGDGGARVLSDVTPVDALYRIEA